MTDGGGAARNHGGGRGPEQATGAGPGLPGDVVAALVALGAVLAWSVPAALAPPRAVLPRFEMLTVDPNTAPLAELEALPRIGPVLARRVVEERRRGRFHDAADLERVSGVGPVTVAGAAPHTVFATPTDVLPPRGPDPPDGGR